MPETKYKHIIWDLDHTLWDFNVNSADCIAELLKDFGLLAYPIRNAELFIKDYKKINDQCWGEYRRGKMDKATLRFVRFQRAFEKHGVSDRESYELANKFGDAYVATCPKKTALIPGTLEVLDYVKSKDYNQVILTNGFLESQEIKMVESGLRPYFTREFISEVIGHKKPSTKVFKAVLEDLKAEVNECIMIGDSLESDIKGANNMKMDSIHFQPDGVKHFKATHNISELTEILEIL